MKITELTAVTLGKKIKAKEITVAEAVSAVLEQIEAGRRRSRLCDTERQRKSPEKSGRDSGKDRCRRA